MSFPALTLACQAVDRLPPLDDEEFGVGWADLDDAPVLEVGWALYRSEGAGLVFGVMSIERRLA